MLFFPVLSFQAWARLIVEWVCLLVWNRLWLLTSLSVADQITCTHDITCEGPLARQFFLIPGHQPKVFFFLQACCLAYWVLLALFLWLFYEIFVFKKKKSRIEIWSLLDFSHKSLFQICCGRCIFSAISRCFPRCAWNSCLMYLQLCVICVQW